MVKRILNALAMIAFTVLVLVLAVFLFEAIVAVAIWVADHSGMIRAIHRMCDWIWDTLDKMAGLRP